MIALLWLAACSGPCGGDQPCTVGDRTYYALPPEGWDGESALPTVIYAHGYGGSPHQYYSDPEVVSAFSDAGVLLLLPEAQGRGWSTNEGGDASEDLDFMADMLDDVVQTWPTDPDRRVMSGFSIGAAMAYAVACYEADLFSAAYPMSGGFWAPLPAECDGPPIRLGDEHGMEDGTWPLGGRELWEGAVQGDPIASFDLLLDMDGCTGEPIETFMDEFSCAEWTSCDGGVVARFCFHDGKHQRMDGWEQRLISFSMP